MTVSSNTVKRGNMMNKILIVCLGNICRSPTAQAVLTAKAKQGNIPLQVDSAGTINYHQGKAPDQRAQAAGEKRGYDFNGFTSRPVNEQDFAYFDYILAADEQNKADLLALCPAPYRHKIHLFLSFSDLSESEIPDPYYGGEAGFEHVLDLLETASEQLLARLGGHHE